METIKEAIETMIPDALDPDEILPARAGYLVQLKKTGFISGVAWAERWVEIETDHNGFATDNALDDIFHELPFLVKDKWEIFLVDNDNAAEWRGDLQRNPNRYLWRPIKHK